MDQMYLNSLNEWKGSEGEGEDRVKGKWRKEGVQDDAVAYPGILFGGVQTFSLRTEGRENGVLGAVAP
jgi:hypothetical protein